MSKSETKDINRLDKCVSHLTGLSRQQATKLIKDGAVRVDGELITKAMTKVSMHSHIVIEGFTAEVEDYEAEGSEVDSAAVSAEGGTKVADAFKKRVFLLNKPFGYVCSERDRNHSVVSTLWGRELFSAKLQAVGRLDVDTTGLLLVTDDGALNHALTSPKKQVSKLYLARLNRPVPAQAVEQFARSIKHPEEEKRYQSATLTILPTQDTLSTSDYLKTQLGVAQEDSEEAAAGQPAYWAAVLLSEGRYHEVKRLFEVVGCEVVELVRVAMGSLLLPEGLLLGEYVPLSDEEVASASVSREFTSDEILELLARYQRAVLDSKLIYLSPEHAAIRREAAQWGAGSAAGDAAGAAGSAVSAEADFSAVDVEAEADYFDELDENGELRIY